MAEQETAPKTPNKVLPKDAERPPGDIRRRNTGAKKQRQGPFIKYVGLAARRQIDPTAWATLNIELKDKKATHVWDLSNDKLVEANSFTDDQLDYLLVDDTSRDGIKNFLAVDYDKDGNLEQVEI